MSELNLPPQLAALSVSGKITADDVRVMRRDVFRDDRVDEREAEMLFALNRSTREGAPEWKSFFVEALCDFIVSDMPPRAEISDDNARWLIQRVSVDGLVDNPACFELLVKVLEKSERSPVALEKFALDQVARAICERRNSLGTDEGQERHVISSGDVALIRRLMFAFGGSGGMAVTREEAEFLFDLNDRTQEFDNHPAWSDLFVRSVANYLMATLGNAVPPREVALKDDGWMQGESLLDKLVNSLRAVYQAAVSGSEATESAMAETNASLIAAMQKAEVVDQEEAAWVSERIGADGILHQNERALLQFLKEESHSLHPSLKALVEKAA